MGKPRSTKSKEAKASELKKLESNSEMGPGVVNFDYERWFPHIFWISQWVTDNSFPEGYCYKILSVRDQTAKRVELVVLLNERNGDKSEMHRFSITTEHARPAGQDWATMLAKKFALEFEEQDYTGVSTSDEFNTATQTYGWAMQPNETGKI
jgi:hypothetical protein